MAARDHFRAWPRRTVQAPVTVRIGDAEEKARLVDIGLGGAGVEHSRPLAIDDSVAIVLHAPNRWDPLVLPSRVAWSTGLRSGLTFVHRSDADAYALFELLGAQVFDG